MGNVAGNVSTFLIHTLATLYIVAVMLRLLLAWARADFYNPLSQFIVTVTNPTLHPLRKFIPSMGSIDTAALLLMLAIKVLELWLLATINHYELALPALLVVSILKLVQLLIYIFIIAIIIQAIASWISPGQSAYHNPALGILRSITEPLLRPVRRLLPPVGMIDLSPMVVIIGLYVILIVLQGIGVR